MILRSNGTTVAQRKLHAVKNSWRTAHNGKSQQSWPFAAHCNARRGNTDAIRQRKRRNAAGREVRTAQNDTAEA
jgi:hypothetical protein